jgi:predicted membrane-bound spermidine synthase
VIRPAALPLLFFASGALALVYEVLWQRRFALVFGGGATAAAAVLAAYFAGLGVGSYVVGRAAASLAPCACMPCSKRWWPSARSPPFRWRQRRSHSSSWPRA